MIAQFSISSEVLATATLFGAIALALAFALLPERRTALVDVVKLLIGALAVTVVVVSPYLLYFEFGHHYPPGATLLLGGPDVVRDPSVARRSVTPPRGVRRSARAPRATWACRCCC